MKKMLSFVFCVCLTACSSVSTRVQSVTSPLDGFWKLTDYVCTDGGVLNKGGGELQARIREHRYTSLLKISGNEANANEIYRLSADTGNTERCELQILSRYEVDPDLLEIKISKSKVQATQINAKREWCVSQEYRFSRLQKYELKGSELRLILMTLFAVEGYDGKNECSRGSPVNVYQRII